MNVKQILYSSVGFCLLLPGLVACSPNQTGPTSTTAAAEQAVAQPAETLSPTPDVAIRPTETAVSPTATATASVTPRPTETAVPSATPTPSGPFSTYNLVLSTGSNRWESAFIDPGAVIFHAGQFHMFYNGISGWPAHVQVGYATSDDGERWTRQTDTPVFTGEGIDYTGVSLFVSSAVVTADGTWMLYFYTIDTGNFSGPGKIGRATADSPFGPFVADPAPVLLPGPAGSWDDHAVLNPSVVQLEDGYAMYYDGSQGDVAENRDRQIGMAFSEDGAVWTKHNISTTTATIVAESDPIFKPGRSGSWDRDRVMDANVMQTPDGWLMIYESSHFDTNRQRRDYGLGVAVSEDGINWERLEENQFLATLSDKGWSAIFLVTAVFHNNRTFLYFDVQTTSTSPTAVYMSTFDGSFIGATD